METTVERTKEMMKDISTKRLLDVYNAITGRKTSKFASREKGEEQVIKALADFGYTMDGKGVLKADRKHNPEAEKRRREVEDRRERGDPDVSMLRPTDIEAPENVDVRAHHTVNDPAKEKKMDDTMTADTPTTTTPTPAEKPKRTRITLDDSTVLVPTGDESGLRKGVSEQLMKHIDGKRNVAQVKAALLADDFEAPRAQSFKDDPDAYFKEWLVWIVKQGGATIKTDG